MATVSRLEALPNELLDAILDFFTRKDIRCADASTCIASLSRLSQCTHSLNRRLEFLLYGTPEIRNTALLHGCRTGNLQEIQKAVSRGANSGVVHIYTRRNDNIDHVDPDKRYQAVSTLQIALKSKQLEAFHLLLDTGADITPPDQCNSRIAKSQLTVFARRLEKPCNVDFLEAFLEARTKTPYWKDERIDNCSQARAVVSRLRFPDVVLWAPFALLTTLIDNGAHLNETTRSKKASTKPYMLMSPLGAACLRGDGQVFDLLVARGAHVDCPSDKHPNHHTHIPVFMAVHHMFDTGKSSMLEACLARGAQLNRPCHTREKEDRTGKPPHKCTTPLLTYLGLVDTWEFPDSSADEQNFTSIDGVSYFIHALAGDLSSPIMPPVERYYNTSMWDIHERLVDGLPSPVEMLLMKWGLGALANPSFLSMIKLLVENGGTGHNLARLLTNCDGERTMEQPDVDSDEVNVEVLWHQFLTILRPHVNSMDQIAKNNLLRGVIAGKVAVLHGTYHYHWSRISAIAKASITFIVSCGADINDTENAFITEPWAHKITPIHQILQPFIHTDWLTQGYLHDHPKDYDCWHTRKVAENLGEALTFLVELGADPTIKGTSSEITAIDTLVDPFRWGRIKHEGGTAEQALMYLVAKLQGESKVSAYTGERRVYHEPVWQTWRLEYELLSCKIQCRCA